MTRGTPAVLTTSGSESDRARAYAEGAASVLAKPVDFQKFREMMESFGFYWLLWNQYPDSQARERAR